MRAPAAGAAVVVSDAVVKAGPWQVAVERTVTGLGYELVDVERAARGLLRVTIDRTPDRAYPTGDSEFILVEDCELVTRQLQHVLEVENCDYQRLEVSSPGLDRPLKHAGDYTRFAGQAIDMTLKAPLDGRRKFRGQLLAGAGPDAWRLVFDDGKGEQALDFALHEVREARLVPVLDFKGRRARPAQAPDADGGGKE